MAWLTGVVLGALTIWLVVGYGFLDYANTDIKPGLYRSLWRIQSAVEEELEREMQVV